MNMNNQSPNIRTLPKVETPQEPDPMEALYKAIGALTRECENTRNSAAISVAKCYASNTALVEVLISKGLLAQEDQEIYLLKSLRNFHASSKQDIEEGLAELESGKSIAPQNIVEGMHSELDYHKEILEQIAKVEPAVVAGEKTYHQFIKELSAYLNEKYNLK